MPHQTESAPAPTPAPAPGSGRREQRERPLNELLSRDMVDIYVGPENTHWVIHEKLLCHRSAFFRNVFYAKPTSPHSRNTAFGLPDDDDEPFRLFVGWLYSGAVPVPREEKDLAHLFELYLMGEKWAIEKLVTDSLDAVRTFYRDTATYPGLRRVQYIYANTEDGSPMRALLIGSIARFLVLGDGMPPHWDKALKKNGQLAVDIILAVQRWKIDEDKVPDPREDSVEPIVEKALEDGVMKKEEDLEKEQGELPNGVKEIGEDEVNGGEQDGGSEQGADGLTNGVNGVQLDDEDDDDDDDDE